MAATRERDLGLDLLRVLALIMMVTIHCTRFLPEPNVFIRSFNAVVGLAPTFFFFAFGMTIEFFLRKNLGEQLERLLFFYILGVCHSIFMQDALFTTEFFLFLCIWQTFFLLADKMRINLVNFFSLILLVSTVLLLLPNSVFHLNKIFMTVLPGPFPLLPFGMFILAGFVYQQLRNSTVIGRTHVSALTLFILWSVTFALYKITGFDEFVTRERYLKIPYILLSSSIIFSILHISSKLQRFYKNPSFVKEKITFLSSNLLLAVVLHYVPLEIVGRTLQLFDRAVVAKYNTLFLIMAFICLNLGLYLTLKIYLYFAKYVFRLNLGFFQRLLPAVFFTSILFYAVCIQGISYESKVAVSIVIMALVSLLMVHSRGKAGMRSASARKSS